MIRSERLACSQWLASQGEEISVAESFVLQGLEAVKRNPTVGEEAMMLVAAAQIAKVGGIFVLDPADAAAIASLEIGPDLPPLPFPRCWFEVWDDTREAPMGFRKVTLGGEERLLLALAVLEVEPANLWNVVASLTTEDGHATMRSWTIRSDAQAKEEGLSRRVVGPGSEDADVAELATPVIGLTEALGEEVGRDARMLFLPVELGHLVTIMGCEPRPFSIPRARRREFQRRYATEHPQVYTVSLRGAGESYVGAGEREYRHRWIVRGHYRRDPGGRFEVPRKGRCVWVRPHVKGPAGAPWKGRPVYTSIPSL